MRSFVLFCLLAAIPAAAQWQLQDAHITANLRGIDYVGNGVAWASGTNGTVLRTEDTGTHWQVCTTPPGAYQLDFRGIQAFDKNTAIVMSSGKGDLSRLYKTTDGCQTWKLVFTNPHKEGFWDAVNLFAPPFDALGKPLSPSYVHGYLVGDPVGGEFSLFYTHDGGETWSRRNAQKRGPGGEGCKVDAFPAKKGETVFASSNEEILSLAGSYFILVTGGAVAQIGYVDHFDLDFALCHDSARLQTLPIAHGNTSSGAFAFAVTPRFPESGNFPDRIVIVGGNYLAPDDSTHTAVYGSKIGTLFQSFRESQISPHGFRSAVAYDKPHNTWITVGPNGTDVSTDDGRNWRPLKPSPEAGDLPDADKHWNALSLPFAVGTNGRIGKLEDLTLKQ